MLAANGLVLATDLLVPFAHWVTPATQPKRYDTVFLMAKAPEDQVALHDGSESVDSVWIRPADALARAEAGQYKLVFATQKNLEKLARFATADDALVTTRASTVVKVVPEQVATKEGGWRQLRLPAEAGYGGDLFWVNLPSAS